MAEPSSRADSHSLDSQPSSEQAPALAEMTADTASPPLSRGAVAFLLTSVFCSGAAVMIVEMAAVRALQPFFGSTNYVWTNVIAVVMASLAIGYAVGGRLADTRGTPTLLYSLMACGGLAVMLGAWSVTFVSEALLPVEMHVEGVSATLARASLAATLILFAPPTLFLGMVSPMAVKLLAGKGVGIAAGRVFALGTVGSIVGTYLPTYTLIPNFGSRTTLDIAAAALIVPALIGLTISAGRRRTGRTAAASLAIAIVALTTGAMTPARPGRAVPELPDDGVATVLAEGESPYQYVTVREDRSRDGRTVRLLTLNEGVYTYHSLHVVGQVLTDSRYYDDYALLPMLLDLEPGAELRTAVVGLAGGVTAHQWQHFWSDLYDLHVDGAEIDPLVVEWGRRWFHLPKQDEPWLDIYVMDGRQMLVAAEDGAEVAVSTTSASGSTTEPSIAHPATSDDDDRGYHIIVIDAFTHELYIPFHLGTQEFFELCKRKLAPGGIVAINVYAYRPDSPNLVALENTLATVFGAAVRVRQFWGGNFVLMARKAETPPDVTRLAPLRIDERFGMRDEISEWSRLVDFAARVPAKSAVVLPDPNALVLTDDHAPLETLMDTVIDLKEDEIRGR